MDETVDEKLAAGIAKQKADPWAYEWVGQSVIHIVSLCAQFPDYFPVTDGITVVTRYMNATAHTLPYVDPKEWDRGLRQSVLNRLKVLCSSCTKCELEQNRIPDRGSVFGDGRVDADILASGEGPGAFEQVTGSPFVDSEALRASTCATKCQNFEECFVTRDGSWSRFVQRDCYYTPVEISKEVLASRTKSRPPGGLATTGQVLGTSLRENRVYRDSFVRVLKMHEESGLVEKGKYDGIKPSIYLTNAVRCRCVKIDEQGRVKDQAPGKEHVAACNPWLEMTIALVKPRRLIGIGATGLSSLRPELPKGWKITQACDPGTEDSPTVMLSSGKAAFVMLHPSYLNRVRDNQASPAGLYDSLLNKFNATIRDCRISVAQEKKTEAQARQPVSPPE